MDNSIILTYPKDKEAIQNFFGFDKSIKDELFKILLTIDIKYSNFGAWFDKIFDECNFGFTTLVERNIVITIDENSVAAIMILKKSDEEKKVCTLVVLPEFRKKGLSYKLFQYSFDVLGTNKPHFTVSEQVLPSFSKIIKKFDFKIRCVLVENGKLEYYFN